MKAVFPLCHPTADVNLSTIIRLSPNIRLAAAVTDLVHYSITHIALVRVPRDQQYFHNFKKKFSLTLVASFSTVSWVALTLVWPNAFTMFASWLAYSCK